MTFIASYWISDDGNGLCFVIANLVYLITLEFIIYHEIGSMGEESRLSNLHTLTAHYDYWLTTFTSLIIPLVLKLILLIVDIYLIDQRWKDSTLICFLALDTNIYMPISKFLNEDLKKIEKNINGYNFLKILTEKVENFEDEDTQCPICLDPMGTAWKTKRCGHVFHLSCLHRCLKVSNHCPMCRRELFTLSNDQQVVL